MSDIRSKNDKHIQEGDFVSTPFRGGKHEGEVEKLVRSQEEAKDEGVKNPPKVLFHDQNGKRVAHNPETLTKEE